MFTPTCTKLKQSSAVEIRRTCRTFFHNGRQKTPVCQTKCPTKNFRPKTNIELGNSYLAKNGGGLCKTKTNEKKSRFRGGTNSKQSKIWSRAVIPTRSEIRLAVAGIWRWSNDIRHALAELRDLRLRQTISIRIEVLSLLLLCVTKVKIIS